MRCLVDVTGYDVTVAGPLSDRPLGSLATVFDFYSTLFKAARQRGTRSESLTDAERASADATMSLGELAFMLRDFAVLPQLVSRAELRYVLSKRTLGKTLRARRERVLSLKAELRAEEEAQELDARVVEVESTREAVAQRMIARRDRITRLRAAVDAFEREAADESTAAAATMSHGVTELSYPEFLEVLARLALFAFSKPALQASDVGMPLKGQQAGVNAADSESRMGADSAAESLVPPTSAFASEVNIDARGTLHAPASSSAASPEAKIARFLRYTQLDDAGATAARIRTAGAATQQLLNARPQSRGKGVAGSRAAAASAAAAAAPFAGVASSASMSGGSGIPSGVSASVSASASHSSVWEAGAQTVRDSRGLSIPTTYRMPAALRLQRNGSATAVATARRAVTTPASASGSASASRPHHDGSGGGDDDASPGASLPHARRLNSSHFAHPAPEDAVTSQYSPALLALLRRYDYDDDAPIFRPYAAPTTVCGTLPLASSLAGSDSTQGPSLGFRYRLVATNVSGSPICLRARTVSLPGHVFSLHVVPTAAHIHGGSTSTLALLGAAASEARRRAHQRDSVMAQAPHSAADRHDDHEADAFEPRAASGGETGGGGHVTPEDDPCAAVAEITALAPGLSLCLELRVTPPSAAGATAAFETLWDEAGSEQAGIQLSADASAGGGIWQTTVVPVVVKFAPAATCTPPRLPILYPGDGRAIPAELRRTAASESGTVGLATLAEADTMSRARAASHASMGVASDVTASGTGERPATGTTTVTGGGAASLSAAAIASHADGSSSSSSIGHGSHGGLLQTGGKFATRFGHASVLERVRPSWRPRVGADAPTVPRPAPSQQALAGTVSGSRKMHTTSSIDIGGASGTASLDASAGEDELGAALAVASSLWAEAGLPSDFNLPLPASTGTASAASRRGTAASTSGRIGHPSPLAMAGAGPLATSSTTRALAGPQARAGAPTPSRTTNSGSGSCMSVPRAAATPPDSAGGRSGASTGAELCDGWERSHPHYAFPSAARTWEKTWPQPEAAGATGGAGAGAGAGPSPSPSPPLAAASAASPARYPSSTARQQAHALLLASGRVKHAHNALAGAPAGLGGGIPTRGTAKL